MTVRRIEKGEVWTKKCAVDGCTWGFVPADYTLCDFHLLAKFTGKESHNASSAKDEALRRLEWSGPRQHSIGGDMEVSCPACHMCKPLHMDDCWLAAALAATGKEK